VSLSLDIRVQIAPGADLTADPATWVWEDITDYVRPGINITGRGRSSESTTAQPSSTALTLRDPDGQWLPHNRASVRWPGWRKGCPLRVQVNRGGVWKTRHTGYVDDRVPRLTSDRAVDTYEVDVTASGILRRLNQGVAVRSPLYRCLTGGDPDAYLPLEDGSGADRPAAHAPTQGPATGADVEFGASAGNLPGASSVARLTTSTGWIRMTVPLVDRPSIGTPVLSVLFYVTSPSLSAEADLATVVVDGAALSRLVVRASSSGLRVTAYNPSGASVSTTFQGWTADANPTTGWVGVSLAVWQPAASAVFTVRIHGAGSRTLHAATSPSFSAAGGLGRITDVTLWSAGVAGTTVAHLWAKNAFAQPPDSSWAAAGYSGEDAAARFERLCDEASVPYVPAGTAGTLMGAQTASDLMALLREVETTDGGLLYEALDGRLAYLPRQARYNLPVGLALTYEQLAPPLRPADDDRNTRNDITVTRAGGSAARVSDEEHVAEHGRYEGSVTVSLDSDASLPNHAAWRVHMGTLDALRHPLVTLNLGGGAAAAVDAWLACDIGSRLTIAGAPPQVAAGLIDQQIEGYSETIDRFSWAVQLNVAPNAPWQVAEVDGEQRVAADGTALATDLTEAGLVLALTHTPATQSWTTDPAHYPLNVRVGGEQIRADAPGNVLNPNPWFVAGVVGYVGAASTIAWTASGRPGTPHGAARITPDGVSAVGQMASLPVPVSASTSYRLTMWAHADVAAVQVSIAADWQTGAGVPISSSFGVVTTLTPGAWTPITVTFVSPATAGLVVMRARHQGTPAATSTWRVAGFTLAPESTVTGVGAFQRLSLAPGGRGLNGVQRLWPAGTEANVWLPAIVAL
jgi:hypothetical protein